MQKYALIIAPIFLAAAAYIGAKTLGEAPETAETFDDSRPSEIRAAARVDSSPVDPLAAVAPAASGESALPDAGPDRLQSKLVGVYSSFQTYAGSWDKNERLEKEVGDLLISESLQDLAIVLMRPAPEGAEERSQHAAARVMGLKMFEVAVKNGRNEEAAQLLRTVAARLHDNGETALNQHLDLESMVRSYFRINHSSMQSRAALVTSLAELGISIAELKEKGLESPYGKGVIVGLLTAANANGKVEDVKTWISATN